MVSAVAVTTLLTHACSVEPVAYRPSGGVPTATVHTPAGTTVTADPSARPGDRTGGADKRKQRKKRTQRRPARRPEDVGIGVYNGLVRVADHDTLRQFGAWPAVASSYYQPHQRVDVVRETARIRRGIVPNLTITTKGTQWLAALADGPSHPDHAAASAWLDTYVADLATLAAVDPEVPVYATIEHEFRAKIRENEVTGRSARLRVYARALDEFIRRADEAHRNIRTTYWIAGYDRLIEGLIGERLKTRPDAILVDPYGNARYPTIAAAVKPDVDWIRGQSWYDGQEVALGELGMPVHLGDEAMARFYRDLRQQLAALDVSWAVIFNRERGFDTRVAERTDRRTFPATVAAIAEAMQLPDD